MTIDSVEMIGGPLDGAKRQWPGSQYRAVVYQDHKDHPVYCLLKIGTKALYEGLVEARKRSGKGIPPGEELVEPS